MDDSENRPRVPPWAYLDDSATVRELVIDARWRAALLRDALAEADSPLTRDAIMIIDVLHMVVDRLDDDGRRKT